MNNDFFDVPNFTEQKIFLGLLAQYYEWKFFCWQWSDCWSFRNSRWADLDRKQGSYFLVSGGLAACVIVFPVEIGDAIVKMISPLGASSTLADFFHISCQANPQKRG